MIMDSCQGKPRTPTIEEKRCPQCGSVIEIFSTDTQVACEKCGFVAYNDSLSCVQWCKYARKCVGDEMYEHMMEIAAQQKARAKAEREAQKGEKARFAKSFTSIRKSATAAVRAPGPATRAPSAWWTERQS